ncbi:M81 family metallopeptidase [Burkholderia anthina]|uniref:M81 family metallopeptidase n=1 Tax=Burkholderia anthina TaxID=179879 RepID=UPI00158BB3EC|nr:M81 family metallopeptidase [Burkholderia anthina]MBY4865140.1 M81 family metallopeptidase [Burkholderia anthina]
MNRLKVFSSSFMHETHSFSPVPADMANFERTSYHLEAEIPQHFQGTRTEIGAVLDLVRRYDWDLVLPVSASTTPSGPVTAQAYDHVTGLIISKLAASVPVDGVLLALHGAMVTEGVADAEGDLLRRVREIVGPAVPIAVTFDIHANVGPDTAKYANIASTYRTTPHIDMYETAERAGGLLQRAMLGECKPQLCYAQGRMFYALDMGRTISGHGPMVDVLRLADKAMAENDHVLEISVNAGFDWSDKEFIGPSVLVTHDQVPEVARRVADELIQFAWDTRAEKTMHLLPCDEAMRIAKEPADKPGPLLIGDFTDCPGGGTAGDGTVLLKALLEANLRDVAFASIADPAAVQTCFSAGVGATVRLSLGGKIDPRFGGTSLDVQGTVIALSEDGKVIRKGTYATGKENSYGRSCVVQAGEVKIIIATERVQVDDREQFRIFGIQPETTNILACKAANHFRADFEPMSRRLIYVDSGGIMSLSFEQFPFRHIRRPVWPLDQQLIA